MPSTYPSFDDTTFFTLLKSNSLYWRKNQKQTPARDTPRARGRLILTFRILVEDDGIEPTTPLLAKQVLSQLS